MCIWQPITRIYYIYIYIYTYTYNNLRWKMRWLVGDWRPPLSLRRIRDASRHSCAGHRNAIVDVCFKVGVVSLIHGFDYMDVLKCMTPSNADTTCRHNMSHCREFVELFLVFRGNKDAFETSSQTTVTTVKTHWEPPMTNYHVKTQPIYESYLSGGDWNHGILWFSNKKKGNLIIPTDELTPSFFRWVGIPPTRLFNHNVVEQAIHILVSIQHYCYHSC